MNMLNSIILEGDVSKVGELVNTAYLGDEKRYEIVFSIQVARTYKNEAGNLVTEAPAFDVLVSGRLAELTHDRLQVGRGVRVVGRLVQKDGVKVFAEHIEYKPVKNKKE